MREVSAVGEVQSHDAPVRLQQAGVHGQVGGGAAVGLHVDSPLLRVQPEDVEAPALAQPLHAVDVLVAAVVPEKKKENESGDDH